MEYIKQGNTIVLRLDAGEEIIAALTAVTEKENIGAASVSGIGAVNRAVIGVLKTAEKEYVKKQLGEDMEIAALTGNISRQDGKPYLHLHIVLGGLNGAYAGHLNEAWVSATAEIYITIVNVTVGRAFDENVGLNLMVLK